MTQKKSVLQVVSPSLIQNWNRWPELGFKRDIKFKSLQMLKANMRPRVQQKPFVLHNTFDENLNL